MNLLNLRAGHLTSSRWLQLQAHSFDPPARLSNFNNLAPELSQTENVVAVTISQTSDKDEHFTANFLNPFAELVSEITVQEVKGGGVVGVGLGLVENC